MCNNDIENNDNCSSVISETKTIAEQICVAPDVIGPGDVFVKIPVILAEANVTIPVEATITLDQPATEIKRIKKNVFLTEARLIPIPIPFSEVNGFFGTGIVFIQGFIRKNIEYATQTCPTTASANFCGDIRQCTVETPFDLTTRVTFFRNPVFTNNTSSELEFFTDKLSSCDACADNVVGKNPCDQSFFATEFFNEKPFVELVRADIAELDIHKNPMTNCHIPTEQLFKVITEKIVVNLTFKLLQNQQVKLEALTPTSPCPRTS
ncbi:CsxC family protein [Candidatus Clostridium radicumherbarum]|uniref:CsxC family protein n=1 Tax=Candidatus Clostridium radicumherbarum TaxID=3381662 RepID=A0ABW8TS86_9CLOT